VREDTRGEPTRRVSAVSPGRKLARPSEALNRLPGIRTNESCCGHGTGPFRVFFLARDLGALKHVALALRAGFTGVLGWHVVVASGADNNAPYFYVEGPPGDYAGAANVTESVAWKANATEQLQSGRLAYDGPAASHWKVGGGERI